jgi:(p)ppGpp synthase/HD superfamily hydrolase
MQFQTCAYSERLLRYLSSLNAAVIHPVDLTEIRKAMYYARKYHGHQRRQSGEPYYSHPLAVAYMLAEYTVEENKAYFRTDLLVTAILHDTLEDTELTKSEIAEFFGTQIAEQVDSLTRIKSHGKISSADIVHDLWLKNDTGVLMVKIFDRLHNVQTIRAKSSEKIHKIMQETIEVFLLLSIHLNMVSIKNKLMHLCYELLPLNPIRSVSVFVKKPVAFCLSTALKFR